MYHPQNTNNAKERQRLFRGPVINDVDKSGAGVGQVTTAILRKAALAPWGSNLFKRRISLRLNPPQFLPRRAIPQCFSQWISTSAPVKFIPPHICGG